MHWHPIPDQLNRTLTLTRWNCVTLGLVKEFVELISAVLYLGPSKFICRGIITSIWGQVVPALPHVLVRAHAVLTCFATIPTKMSLARCARESHVTVKFCIRPFAVRALQIQNLITCFCCMFQSHLLGHLRSVAIDAVFIQFFGVFFHLVVPSFVAAPPREHPRVRFAIFERVRPKPSSQSLSIRTAFCKQSTKGCFLGIATWESDR